MSCDITVVLPTHNPHAERLARTLRALRAQTLPASRWETVVVDNASTPPLVREAWHDAAPANLRLVHEPTLGLTAARRRGFTEARAPVLVLVDDDNVLAPDYLAQAVRLFAEQPQLGAGGGRIHPEFETEPPGWTREFFPLLALRDLGERPAIVTTLYPAGAGRPSYPPMAPIGAGMALRRNAVEAWLVRPTSKLLPDRSGADLTSGGDNDIVLSLLEAGWHVGYFPELSLTHLIPATRFAVDYLARLNRGIQKSWMQVLMQHAANPWPPLPPTSVPFRKIKAWFTYRAWSCPAARVRWQGACGHFEGRVVRA